MYLICFLALILVAVVSGQSGTIPEKFLKPLRPDPSGGGPLRVGVAWHISRIHHICLNDMFLEVSLRTTFSWQDKSVIDSGAPDGIIPLHMSYLQTSWKPDLFFKEIRDIQRFSMVDDLKGLWLSQKNGTFVMSFLMKISLDCPMKFTLFPFDVQTCWMTMVSYEYNENELSLEWMSQGVTVMKHLQKQIPSYYLSVRPGNSTIDFTCQNCMDEPAAALISAIRLERRYVSYLITTYFPSIFLMGIAWASLFWTPDPTPGRTSLIITTLLTTVVLYGIVRHLSPITDYSKGTDVWFFFCICFNVTIIAEFATVIWIRRLQNKLIKASTLAVEPIYQVDPTANPRPVPAAKKHAALRLQALQWKEEKLETISKWVFPVVFLIFNLIYWSFYLHKYDKTYWQVHRNRS